MSRPNAYGRGKALSVRRALSRPRRVTTVTMVWRRLFPGRWPPARVILIYAVEMAERFNYYGMASLLALFLTGGPPKLAPAHAAAVFSFFTAAAYASPLLGSAAAATKLRIFGTIVLFSLIYLAGMVLLPLAAVGTSTSISRWLCAAALTLIAIGTGGIKPNVAAFGAMQMSDTAGRARQVVGEADGVDGNSGVEQEEARLQSFFTTFYFCINAGAISGQLAVPAVQRSFGYAASFSSSTGVLVVAILLFVGGQVIVGRGYIHEDAGDGHALGAEETSEEYGPIHAFPDERVLGPSWAEFYRITVSSRLGANWGHARRIHGEDRCSLVSASVRAMQMLFVMPLFWAGHSSMGSVWIVQADKLILPLGLSAAQWSAINPIGVLIALPACAAASRALNIRRTNRVILGFALGSLALFMSAGMQIWIETTTVGSLHAGIADNLLQSELPHRKTLNGLWTLPQWLLLAIAEVLASVSSLEAAYAGAPSTLRSGMQAAWLVASAVGSMISGLVFAALGDGSNSLLLLGAVMAVGTLTFSKAKFDDAVECNAQPTNEENVQLVPHST